MSQIAGREAEEARVRKVGSPAVDPRGIAAQEILQYLRVHGDRTLPGLARELNMEIEILEGYVQALKRRRLITLTATQRGTQVVRLGPARRTGSPRSGGKRRNKSHVA